MGSFDKTMKDLGVHENLLSSEEKNRLDTDGFILVPQLIESKQILAMHQSVNGVEPGEPNLQNISSAFDVLVTHPKILAGIWYLLKSPFVSSGVHYFPNMPRSGQRPLHVDYTGGPVDKQFAAHALCMVSDFTRENGATRMVPGSQWFDKSVLRNLKDRISTHPQEVLLTGTAGTVIIFNCCCWHSLTFNHTEESRIAVVSYWRQKEVQIMNRNWGTCNLGTQHRLQRAKELFL